MLLTWRFFKRLGFEYVEDDCPRMAAALAYYTVFSLPAMIAVVLFATSLLLSESAVYEAVQRSIDDAVGHAANLQVSKMVDAVRSIEGAGVVATIVSTVALLFGATRAFAELQAALNRIWGVTDHPQRAIIRSYLMRRLGSFAVLLSGAVLVILSLLLKAILAFVGSAAGAVLSPEAVTRLLPFIDGVVSLGLLTLVLALIYRVVPDAVVDWRDAWFGALMTGALVAVGNLVFGLYLGSESVVSAYGAAGTLAMVLLWIYYMSLIVLLGGELVHVFAAIHGRDVRPTRGTVRVARRVPDVPLHERQLTRGSRPTPAPARPEQLWLPGFEEPDDPERRG